MNQQQHEQACQEAFDAPFSEVHAFLDQYYSRFPGMNHRILLHHRLGIELVVRQFGEAARGPAEQHIRLDWGFIPESWEDLERHYFPLSLEEAANIEQELMRLYPDFPGGRQKTKGAQ